MPAEIFKRKLTAILSADVKGYSRLMGEDEEGTIRTPNAYLEAITGFIQKHHGRIVGTAGDSIVINGRTSSSRIGFGITPTRGWPPPNHSTNANILSIGILF